jgi:beta-lactamase class A
MIRLLLFSFFFCFTYSTMAQNENHWQQIRNKTAKELQALVDQLKGVAGVAVLDLKDREKVGVNTDLVFAQGSSIKIPILMEVFKQANEGKFKLSDVRTVQKTDQIGGSGVLHVLEAGSVQMTIRDLATLMMVLSDNTATNMLIDLVGMENINRTLLGLGFTKTKVQRKMIQPQESAKGNENISSPDEALLILEMLYQGKFISPQISEEIMVILKKRGEYDSSDLKAGLPPHVSVALKDGAVSGVSTEWMIVLLPERPFAIVFMENYELDDESVPVMKAISKLMYEYFWRKGNVTKYGVFVNPSLLKKD